jgi:hypothetical protein
MTNSQNPTPPASAHPASEGPPQPVPMVPPGMVSYPMNTGQMTALSTKLDKADKRRIAFQSAHETPEGEQVPSQVLLPQELDAKYAGVIGEARSLDISDPTELDLSKNMAKNQVYLEVNRIGQVVSHGIPPNEMASFAIKEQAAREYMTLQPDPAQDGPETKSGEEGFKEDSRKDSMDPANRLLLETEANITGESLEDLSRKIVIRADAFRASSGTIAGLRRKYEQLISEAATTAEVEQLLRNFSAEIEGPMDRAMNFANKKGA